MATRGSVRDFPLAPLKPAAWWTLVAASIFTVSIAAWASRHAPAPFLKIGLPVFIALVMLAIGLMLRRRSISLADGVLVVRAAMYTRRVAVDMLDLAAARVVDLAEHTEFAPAVKLNGYGLPGFLAGHFLLRDRRRAFCLLTARDRVLVLPVRDAPQLLLSPERPQQLLDALQALAPSQARG